MEGERQEQPRTSLWRSWTIQRRVIGALLMREIITRYGRHNIGFLWLFVEPMLFTVGVTAIWSATKAVHGSNLPIAAFALTGYSSVLVWRNMPSRLVDSISPNLSLMYHRNVKIFDVFAARLTLEGIGVAISFFFLTIFFAGIGWIQLPEDVLKVVVGWVMLAWWGSALGMFMGALSHRTELIDKFWHPTAYLLFPLSGSAFLVDALPPEFARWILYLPMVHGVECVRDGFFGSHFTAHYDLGYMAMCNLTFSLLGLLEIKRASRNLVPA
ncbi:ABC-2 type transport system permease protein/capsular polysaccharide transport system permease protein [Sphingobium sp. OAS761]|uniref:ABC transporter permease n=1 Tax=Sphingobium sp. OAS761 TaxID=2817901 RepID=UPI00209F0F89|nr:ABC transporter permease [Sphingobium sp. OAS761]MCP1470672.1 ABC-2 type transport system permease protein/capsular polysaccharide transport system permease protein [Sphingobium sp. OAS761]